MSHVTAAFVIWAAMIGASVLASGVVVGIAARSRHRPPRSEPGPFTPTLTRRALEAARRPPEPDTTKATQTTPETPVDPRSDDERFADEVSTAAARAAVTADRRQAEWAGARRTAEAAWQAFEVADTAARRAIRAEAFPIHRATPGDPDGLGPVEYRHRERHLCRAARAAHAKGEISTDQLVDALSHRNGFDPAAHPIAQDLLLRRLARDRLLQVYRSAAALERTAWHEAQKSATARHSLERAAAAAVARTVLPPPQTRRLLPRPALTRTPAAILQLWS